MVDEGWRWITGRWIAAALAGLAAFSATTAANAQQQTFYLDRLFMAGAPDDAVGLWRPPVVDSARVFGQLGLGFAARPFRAENEISNSRGAAQVNQRLGSPVPYQFITYADVGIELLKRFSLQVELPFVVGQGNNPTNLASVAEARDTTSPTAAAVMDMRLDARATLWRNEAKTWKLGAEAAVFMPTGNGRAYAGDNAMSGLLGLAAEYDIKTVFFLLDAGVHFRPTGHVNSFTVGSEFRYAVGAFVPLRDGSLRIGAQVFGSAPFSNGLTGPGANLPLEWMAEGRYWLGGKRAGYLGAGAGTHLTGGYAPDLRLIALAGYSFGITDTDPPAPARRFKVDRFADHGADSDHDGIPDDIDLCPNEPEDHKPPNPDDGCPAPADRDGDGIPDNVDKCPDQPEDFDGIQDEDGCPEDDADKDGIPDAQDACPLEPGDPDPDPKKNGCPKFIRRVSGSSEIQVLKVIEFETGKANILKQSFPILDEVVRLLKVNVEIAHLEIEGHTDNRGSDALNEKLSNDRAHSVMAYIVGHGIVGDRLSAQGFGPKRPIADNNTVDGRQKNRRVEFHIKNQNLGGGVSPSGAPSPQVP